MVYYGNVNCIYKKVLTATKSIHCLLVMLHYKYTSFHIYTLYISYIYYILCCNIPVTLFILFIIYILYIYHVYSQISFLFLCSHSIEHTHIRVLLPYYYTSIECSHTGSIAEHLIVDQSLSCGIPSCLGLMQIVAQQRQTTTTATTILT